MDGVLVRGSQPVPGADKFIQELTDKNVNYLVFTNNPLSYFFNNPINKRE